MRKMKLLFSNEMTLDDDRKMRLEYNLMENRSIEKEELYYGIQIIKYLGDELEIEEIKGISSSREKAEAITRILFQHGVTPISMVEIVDDIITLEAV